MIISVDYRVRSNRGISFRKWANNVLKQYLLKGYVIDGDRVTVSKESFLELENNVREIKNEIAEIKEMSTADLAERVETEVANYNQMLLNHSISPLENPAQIKQLRRTIARMKTVLRERELNNK